jgi:hypothetical protein
MLDYSNQLALALLKLHRDSALEASAESPPEDLDELRARLIAKLGRLKSRNDDEDGAGP